MQLHGVHLSSQELNGHDEESVLDESSVVESQWLRVSW